MGNKITVKPKIRDKKDLHKVYSNLYRVICFILHGIEAEYVIKMDKAKFYVTYINSSYYSVFTKNYSLQQFCEYNNISFCDNYSNMCMRDIIKYLHYLGYLYSTFQIKLKQI